MIRSILVALDDTDSSQTARRFAIAMAKRRKAILTGLGVVDKPWLTAPEAVPIGGAAFKADLDQQLVEDAKKHIHKVERTFKKECSEKGISCSIVDTTGEPTHEISKHLVDHDVLVVGKDADFHFAGTSDRSSVVKALLDSNPRPLILTGTSEDAGKDIIVTYDGSQASSRTIHIAILLDLFKFATPHLVTIAASKKGAKDTMKLIIQLFKNHGIEPVLHPIESSSRPSIEIINLAERLDTAMVVMGACGHKGIQYLLSGSVSQDLLKSTQYPFFIYH
jgi:nucleotide-binding universal stress UspA family protein